MSQILAQAPGEHCIAGVKHTGEPVGYTEIIAGAETYISKPTSSTAGSSGAKKIIFFFADVYGPLYINNKLIQDYFATQGFLVVGIDYFEGDPIYINSSKPDWEEKKDSWFAKSKKRAGELVPEWIKAVKDKFGFPDTRYHAVGYCFGAPFVLDHGANGNIHSGAIAHPAFLDERHFENVKVPIFLSCAEIDHTFGLESRRRAEDILIAKKALYHFQVFSGVAHGFAVRGNPDVENERWAKEQSASGIIAWFERFSK